MATTDPVRAETEALSDALYYGREWKNQDFAGAEIVEMIFAVGRGPHRRVFLTSLSASVLVGELGKHSKDLRLMEAYAIRNREDSLTDVLAQMEADLRLR